MIYRVEKPAPVFGVPSEEKAITNLPPDTDKYKIRLRPTQFGTIVIKRGSKYTRHYLLEVDDHLEPSWEIGKNLHTKT